MAGRAVASAVPRVLPAAFAPEAASHWPDDRWRCALAFRARRAAIRMWNRNLQRGGRERHARCSCPCRSGPRAQDAPAALEHWGGDMWIVGVLLMTMGMACAVLGCTFFGLTNLFFVGAVAIEWMRDPAARPNSTVQF